MSRHRLEDVRPRYGRIAVAAASSLVTLVAVLGGVGLLPAGTPPSSAGEDVVAVDPQAGEQPLARDVPSLVDPAPAVEGSEPRADAEPEEADEAALPARSGTGRRVVFSESEQRVWLVAQGGRVERTYLVSGSLYDNLDPGTYEVFSRSEQAWGIDDSGTMRWFVRFAHGPNAAIGFHDIPVDDGAPVQAVAQLGTPLSHGCIRQRTADAKALWAFAPLGTTVVVTA